MSPSWCVLFDLCIYLLNSYSKCHHILNARELWVTQDGTFSAEVFYQNIIDLFTDEEWSKETLLWWNK